MAPISRPLLLGSLLALAGCAPVLMPPAGHEMLNAVLWSQGAEHEALTRQIYRLATANLERALADSSWSAAPEQTADYRSLPPAVMLDLDETVLDNSRYEARIVRRLGSFSRSDFDRWCEERASGVVPGAREFLEYAHARGVRIVYFSSRDESMRECTTDTLVRQGLPLGDPPSSVLLDDGTSKIERREQVARSHRVLLVLGDNLEDFLDGSRSSPQERATLAWEYREWWGTRWIMLPNPMYGHWEAPHYGFDYGASRATRIRRKLEALQE